MSEPKDSKAVLIEAAMRLFAEHGYEATSTRDIVRAAGVNISLIAYYFGGKEGLIEACLGKIAQQFEKYKNIPFGTDLPSFRAYLQQLIHLFLTSHIADPLIHRVVQREIDRDSPAFRRVLGDFYLEFFRRFVDFFRHGQQHGWVANDLDPVTLAIALHGSMLQQIRVDHLRREFCAGGLADPELVNQVSATITRIFLEGIGDK